MRKRVYHPVTGEPHDPPSALAEKLVLEQGWLQQPIDPDAEPAVREVAKTGRGSRSRRSQVEDNIETSADDVDETPIWQSSPHMAED